MATNSTLLCIHRDPGQLSLLQDHGYELVTATNGHEGLQLFMSRAVDAIVLEHQLGLLDGLVVAAEIKKVKPHLPIVMLADDMDLPSEALTSLDAIVAKGDGLHFLAATVHFVLNVKPVQRSEAQSGRPQASSNFRRTGRPRGVAGRARGQRSLTPD